MNEPTAYWLTFTNIALGLVVLVCCGAVVIGILQELAARRKKAQEFKKMDRAVADLVASYEGHAFDVPGLGLTMADGGEPLPKKEEER